jgi:hypothetical protein
MREIFFRSSNVSLLLLGLSVSRLYSVSTLVWNPDVGYVEA